MSKTTATMTRTASGLTRSYASLKQRNLPQPQHIRVQREAVASGVHADAPQAVRQVVESPGRPLDSTTRAQMEPRFGYDLSTVRVHTDERAAASARAVRANAYTAGSHIAFDSGRYAPDTPGGQRLMAHELTHVVQQSQGPVAGRPIGEGVSVSDSADPFERQARKTASSEHGSQSEAQGGGARQRLSGNGQGAEGERLSVQRDEPTADEIKQQTAASEKSAVAGEVSAAGGVASALASIGSAFIALRAANFAGRSAEAAEDPPSAEPTTGGIAVTDADIPEVKALEKGGEEETSKTSETGTQTTTGKDVGTSSGSSRTKTKGDEATTTQSGSSKSDRTETTTSKKDSTTKTIKEADSEKTWHLLNINQGKDDSADFYVTVRANGEDIKDGGTEPGPSAGYLGGTFNSNASVTFKARPGAHDKDGNASVRLLIGGTNVPPRKTMKSTGWLGGGGPEANKNYKVQRFGGAVKFFAKKDAKPVVERLDVGPDKAGGSQSADTGDTKQPLVTVSLNPPASGGSAPNQQPVPPKAAAPAAPAAPAVPAGNS